MEPFENSEIPEEETLQPVPEEVTPPREEEQIQPEQSAYHGTGAGRKESPYAQSPYVMNQQPCWV